jgi:transcriptional regulator
MERVRFSAPEPTAMYVPRHFEQTDLSALHAFIEQHSFALLCSTAEDGTPFASHLPMLLDRSAGEKGTLVGHMARANPQWRHAEGKPVLAVFSGPHHYISPAWYESERVVPTWNYVAVHAAGTLQTIHDRAELMGILRDVVAYFESGRAEPWRIPEDGYAESIAGGTVGFRIEVARLDGKWKVGQNHPADRRERAARALRAQGGEDALAIAELMEQVGRARP